MNEISTAFRLATRSEAKPLIGLYSESGCGKTWSALLLARGFVGSHGTIGMIETEGGRGEAYVGRQPVGDYLVRPIRGDFSPMKYGDAITGAEQAKLDALIIDSASHEWEGAGGVLSMAADNQAKGTKGVLVWQQPKISHQRNFMLRLMQTPIPLVIVCMRAKYPMEQVRNHKGEMEWARSKTLEPKQADDILFEMFVHGWIDAEHKLHVTKYTLPELADVILDNAPITIETGARLAAWAKGSTTSPPTRDDAADQPAPPAKSTAQAGAGEIAIPDWQEYVDRWSVIIDEARNAKELHGLWNSPTHKHIRREIIWPEPGAIVPDPLAELQARVTQKIEALKPKARAAAR
jgi:hypothetical protein